MNSRDNILHKVRTALGRSAGEVPAPVPEPWIRVPDRTVDQRIDLFRSALEKLNGKVHRAASKEDARDYAARLLSGRTAVSANTPLLSECGISTIEGVHAGITDRVTLRETCAVVDAGITSADYALAETGTLVMFSSEENPRLVSLLPPLHLAIVPIDRLLTGLDELLTLVPVPSERSSSMVFITGPSRTADIEQILVRGVHGPGEIHVVLV
jgi:L-lactate utilization protein LutC